MATGNQKVTVTLPKGLLERLKKTVPQRKRSLFIKEAVEEHLELIEQAVALEETAGIWKQENHPTMTSDAGIDGWLKASRQDWG